MKSKPIIATQRTLLLLALWLLGIHTAWAEKLPNDSTQKQVCTPDCKIPQYADSVYAQRLKTIPALISLHYNQHVRKYIEYYTVRRREVLSRLIAQAEHYFPLFEPVLDKYNLPLELKYLPVIESALNPNAVSRAGATGLWQFMYSTGKLYGLKVSSYVDERRDPLRATEAAARLMANLYQRYGDWLLVLAAYNCGPGNVNRAIKKAGGKEDFWLIYDYLPRETRNYVPLYVAAVYALNFYEKHNVCPAENTLPRADTVSVKKTLKFSQIAEVIDMPVEQIALLNPQFKRRIVPANSKKSYVLRLPPSKVLDFIALEDSIYNTNPKKKQKKQHYAHKAKTKKHTTPPKHTKLFYTVRKGDNLSYIASWYRVKINQIKNWNNLKSNLILVGQKLKVYVPEHKAGKFQKLETMTFAQKQSFSKRL